jgi:hypothetical protein
MTDRKQQNYYQTKSKQASATGVQVGKHLLKTKICSLYLNGRCHYGAERCFYAHSVNELREQPKLERTSLCPDFKKGSCLREDCKYAHSLEEMSAAAKQVTCLWYQNGHCSHGASCRYLHADFKSFPGEELPRSNSTLSAGTFSPSTTPTVYSPLVHGSASFDEADCDPPSGSHSILDLLVSEPDVYCTRCGSSIGCICKVFDECSELLRLL